MQDYLSDPFPNATVTEDMKNKHNSNKPGESDMFCCFWWRFYPSPVIVFLQLFQVEIFYWIWIYCGNPDIAQGTKEPLISNNITEFVHLTAECAGAQRLINSISSGS